VTTKPNPDTHQFLISTPSRFVGTYDSPYLAVDHAWQSVFSRYPTPTTGDRPGPDSRNYYVVTAEIPSPAAAAGVVVPNYTILGDRVCSTLSVLFGKRFDNHGFIVSHGFYSVPDLGALRPALLFDAGPNSHAPRPDLGIELNLKCKISTHGSHLISIS
jgi:hypothetical protein